MTIDLDRAPSLWAVLNYASPRPHKVGKRAFQLSDRETIDEKLLTKAVDELEDSETANIITPEQLATIAQLVWRYRSSQKHEAEWLLKKLDRVLISRWNEIAQKVAEVALANRQHRRAIFSAFPALVTSPQLIDAIGSSIDGDDLVGLDRDIDLTSLAPPTKAQLRRLLPYSKHKVANNLAAYLLVASARENGWTPWMKLFAILLYMPELAGDQDVTEPVTTDVFDTEEGLEARRQVWATICNDMAVREVAQLIWDLDGALAYATPDVRGVYVSRLRSSIATNDALRQATVEALLWCGRERQRDLAIYAVVNLTEVVDGPLLDELVMHPDRRTQYDAQLVRDAILGEPVDSSEWPIPSRGGIAEGLFRLRLAQSADEGPARTWVGHRLLEKMIEHTAASLEERFARDYPLHYGVGEEKLAERFFTSLGHQFELLDRGLLETAKALRTGRRTSVRVRYRPVDKAEEGGVGVSRTGGSVASGFSADLCLIVDAVLDGKPLVRRATLVQAKRLYPRDRNDVNQGWKGSFSLTPHQTTDLLRQTASSFYLFEGPGLSGRGLPVLSAQLVADLAHHQNASGKVIAASTVGRASQTFADWFTYDVVGLRTGDPLAELLAKADRGPGSSPYDLVRLGVVEVELRVGDPLKDGE